MNAEGLLAHYARIADAPDAIARLRRFVLDLAVRGKLVEQDAREESASKLLAKINQAKEARIASGDIRKPRDLVKDGRADQLFSVPAAWKWIRLDEVGAIVGGGTPSASDPENFAEPGQGVPWLTPADLGGFKGLYVSTGSRDLSEKGAERSSATVMPRGTVLFTSRAPIGYVAIAANPLATNQGFKSVVPYVDECSRFIALVLKAFAPEIDAKAPGTTFKEVSGKIVAGIPFPLAPLGEQQRIVAKVDELMALCDQLEAAGAQREATRDRLAAASLARLNTPDPDTFPADARFAIDVLPALTTRPDQIKQLRQTILNLAVRGKLVPQDPADNPVSDFLRLIHKGKSDLNAPSLTTDNGQTHYPASWKCVELSSIANVGTGLTPLRAKTEYFDPPVVPWVTSGETGQPFIVKTAQFVSPLALKETGLKMYPPGTLLVAMYGQGKTRGQITELRIAATTNQACAAIEPLLADDGHRRYIRLLFEKIYDEIRELSAGGAQPNLNLGKIKSTTVPLPPLAEQQRIAAKVDELMALCDQLEASLTTGETTRSRLLDALLHEALAPAPAVKIEHPRAAVSGYVISRLASRRNFGRTAHMKHIYLAESRLGLKLGGRYMREAAGPLDTSIYELEEQAKAAGWYTHRVETLPSGKEKVSYVPGKALKALAEEGVAVLGPSRAEMDRLIDLMGDLKTEQVEIIATLFAAWNDAVLDGHTPDDDWIVREVREHWHASKQRFAPAELHKWLGWMRQNDMIPLGYPPRTMQQTTMEL